MAIRRFPIGFHIGPGGNASGLGEKFMVPLDMAGIAFTLKSVDTYPADAVNLAIASGVPHTIVWRKTSNSTYPYDVPEYSMSPHDAAKDHLEATLLALPPEFDMDHVWLEPINEVDKNRSEWLAEFAWEYYKMAKPRGLKLAMFGWSTGEPEPEHWLGPMMLNWLNVVAADRNNLAIALHEYSLSDSILNGFPYLIGRYAALHTICDKNNIARPNIIITEWGWKHDWVPEVGAAIADIDLIAKEYVAHENILGAALWYLGPGFNGIANIAQKLIDPVGKLALSWEHYPGEVEPPVATCIDTTVFTRHHLLRPRNLTAEQWDYVRQLMEDGMHLPDGRHVFIGYEGWSHLDAMGSIKEAVLLGRTDSRLIIMDGHLIGTGLNGVWMAENCPLLLPYTVWTESGVVPTDPFGFDAWPTDYKVVTQHFGKNPQNYDHFCDDKGLCLPGHDGVDFRAPEGTPIYAVADGDVYRVELNPSASNYGIHVRLQHSDGYKTVYAHFSRVASGLAVGDRVSAGQIIGYSGNTGNSFGAHLHLTLKRDGYNYVDQNGKQWPWNIHDPEPFLKPLCPSCFNDQPAPSGQARLGLHASADPGLAAGEVAAFKAARVELVKILSTLPGEDVSRLAQALPGVPFVVRAFVDFGGRNVTPEQFFEWTVNDVRRAFDLLRDREVIVELHNEPNISHEGMWTSWNNGVEFATWLFRLSSLYSEAFPSVALAYPGLSPGGAIPDLRYDSKMFLNESMSAARSAVDMVALHTYWSDVYPMSRALDVVNYYAAAFGSKPLVVTEASNNNRNTSAQNKGAEYIAFARELKRVPSVYGVTYYIASASNPVWGWDSGSGEVWVGTDIPTIVGSR